MVTRILVPLDGSQLAEHALAVAAKLARSSDGTLILIQALPMTSVYASFYVPEVLPPANEEEEPRARAYLTQQAGLPMLSGLSVETAVLTGPPALSILEAAANHKADMIVMTSHGRSGLSRWVFGSVAEHVARQANTPVLVLRQHLLPFWTEGADPVERPTVPGQVNTVSPFRVLIPLDGSPLAASALEPAASCSVSLVRGIEQALASPTGSLPCLIHLVLVVRPLDTLVENMPEALVVSGAENYLKQEAKRLEAACPQVKVSWDIVTGTDIAGTLVSIAEGSTPAENQHVLCSSNAPVPGQEGRGEAGGYSLLAMATHGRTGITRWVWGSITERVVQKTDLPLLLVRPRQNE
jgi:nucleotide-binding universal stress UspA family protein